MVQKKEEERIFKFCDLNEIGDETHFLLQCRNYKGLRKGLIGHLNAEIISTSRRV